MCGALTDGPGVSKGLHIFSDELSNCTDCTTINNEFKLQCNSLKSLEQAPQSPPPPPTPASCSKLMYVTMRCARKCLRAAIQAQNCRFSPLRYFELRSPLVCLSYS